MFITLSDLGLGFIRSSMLYHGPKITVQQLRGINNQLMTTFVSVSGHKVLCIRRVR